MEDKQIQILLEAAYNASFKSYSPYSHNTHGAAIMTNSNLIYVGCTLDNASYPLSSCATRNAIVNTLNSELGDKILDSNSPLILGCALIDTSSENNPLCGTCCQILLEFGNFPIYLGKKKDLSSSFSFKCIFTSQLMPYSIVSNRVWNVNAVSSLSNWWKNILFTSYTSTDGSSTPLFLSQLIKQAVEAAKKAYVPISNFPVGAALLTDKGIFKGSNVENASLQSTICAERAAIANAIVGGATQIKACCVYFVKLDDKTSFAKPCGGCRQSLIEFGKFDIFCLQYCGDGEWKYYLKNTYSLLPEAFTPFDLIESDTNTM